MKKIVLLAIALLISLPALAHEMDSPTPTWLDESIEKLETELVAEHGEEIRPALSRGMEQVAALWRAEDGDNLAFESFVRNNFVHDEETREAMFNR
ncbi:MAG: hypothetical protein R3338_15345, partial [Thermoanaerobaculia bacterium]|nr:hypothetical protein [Thermoanaerobaculia bacterium]